MDIQKGNRFRGRLIRRLLWSAAGLSILAVATWWLTGLQPAAPTVNRATLWTAQVERGDLVVAVRGTGTLVPEHIRWITPTTDGRVERVLARPGQAVTAGTTLLELSNSERHLAARDAEWALRAAEADRDSLNAQLLDRRLEHQAAVEAVRSEQTQARLRLEMNESLAEEGLIAAMDVRFARIKATELNQRLALEEQRAGSLVESIRAQLAAQEARVARLRDQLALCREQVEALQVRAGMDGILQELPVEVGQRVQAGQNLAKVARATPLKAELRIAEALAKDLRVGLPATIDTRNVVVRGRVARIDPAVRNGTVTVDVGFTEPMPADARPDLTVDGTVELAHLTAVLVVDRPTQAQSAGTIGLYRIDPDGRGATLVQVQIGRCSVSRMEVVGGLRAGDQIILSDMTQWASAPRVNLK